ncbi:MAG: GMC family oxidoreductase [Methylococcales bacterium]|nr:GMC family oxidoreductase [Methylococcales bacterium]MBT7410716.1 GMC family oxidoreductase [Methylococcales bacterium]
MTHQLNFEAIIIGSGFGGSICACRLAKKWPGKVLLLERGKRYPMASFPRSPKDISQSFWNLMIEKRERPKRILSQQNTGLYDIRSYRKMDAVVAAGLGGGSLIYANVFLQPPKEVFDERWPTNTNLETLQPYYQVTKAVMGAREIPQNNDPRRYIQRTRLFEDFAKSQGKQSERVDINVFFGNDFKRPLAMGIQAKNRFGATQTSCVYCGECDFGCNTHSKNTLDLNYLYVAENKYQTKIMTECIVNQVIPLNQQGNDDSSADGGFGYRVCYVDINKQAEYSFTAKRVIVSAGTLGTNELLLRCRDIYKTLPNINGHLGKKFSGNGDFLSFVIEGDKETNPNYGPVITQKIDYNLYDNHQKDHAFILEDAAYPALCAWFIEGAKPGLSHFSAIWSTVKAFLLRFFTATSTGRIGYIFHHLLGKTSTNKSIFLLCMGLDKSNGQLSLNKNDRLNIDWPSAQNWPLYQAILTMGRHFKQWSNAQFYLPLPSFLWPFRKNVTVHCLGGCALADSPEKGVTSARAEDYGQVFGYQSLYVVDGSLLPTAVGANPAATISAISERVAEGITQIKPDVDL